MFGSYPCAPGFNNLPCYTNTYFYCSLCDGIVRPKIVKVASVSSTGDVEGLLPVLRCKSHFVKGFQPNLPITTLWGLTPKTDSVSILHERMARAYSWVQKLDVLTIIGVLGFILSSIAAVVVGFVIDASLMVNVSRLLLPCVFVGLGGGLFLLSSLSAYFSRLYFKEWLNFSRDYIQCCELVCIQGGVNRYKMLTSQPPTCCLKN